MGRSITVRSFFHNHPLAFLVTLDRANVPETSVVYFLIEPDFTCYFFTKEETRKYQNIVENSRVTLSVSDEDLLMFGEVTGEATTVTDSTVLLDIMPKLQTIISSRQSKYWVPPIAQLKAGRFALFRVVPEKVRLTEFSTETIDAKPTHIMLERSDLLVG